MLKKMPTGTITMIKESNKSKVAARGFFHFYGKPVGAWVYVIKYKKW